MTDIRATIDSYADLEDGWDSYGGQAVDPRAIAAAKRLAVSPSTRGGVEFEWVGADDTVIFTIAPDGRLEGAYVASTEWDVDYEWERPSKPVSWKRKELT